MAAGENKYVTQLRVLEGEEEGVNLRRRLEAFRATSRGNIAFWTGQGALAGVFLGASKAAWYDNPVHKKEAKLVLARAGRLMMKDGIFFGALGLAFAGGEAVSSQLRGSKGVDPWNHAIGGATAGGVIAVRNMLRLGPSLATVGAMAGAGAMWWAFSGNRNGAPLSGAHTPFGRRAPAKERPGVYLKTKGHRE